MFQFEIRRKMSRFAILMFGAFALATSVIAAIVANITAGS